MKITSDIKYIGVNDYDIDLFEGMYRVPKGMSYNSYAILDEKIAIVDTVDKRFTSQCLENIQKVLGNQKPDYLIVQHMEPDHSANIMNFVKKYPEVMLVASAAAFRMMMNFFGTDFVDKRIVVSDGDILSLGKHQLTFVTAPMVHWPEVIVTYDSTAKILFSADGFGKFGAIDDGALEIKALETETLKTETLETKTLDAEALEKEISDTEADWACEARRYYIGIVGKYGVQVQNLLKKLADKEIQMICPLHGPVLSKDIGYYVGLYNTWSNYQPEEEGIFIAYTSVYGNTKEAVLLLEAKLKEKGCPKVIVKDLARCDMAETVADAFCYPQMVLATTTYNGDIFPPMREFINCLRERNFSNRKVALIENGSWASVAAKIMKERLEKCKGISFMDASVKIMSALNEESLAQLEMLAEELCRACGKHL